MRLTQFIMRHLHQWKIGLLVASLVLLQVLQPFIHVHVGAQEALTLHGLHLADVHEVLGPVHQHVAIDAAPHSTHIDSVGVAFKQDINFNHMLSLAVWLFASLFVAFTILTAYVSAYPSFCFYQSLKRRLPLSRAPPQY